MTARLILQSEIVDNITSTATDFPLSANQGSVLAALSPDTLTLIAVEAAVTDTVIFNIDTGVNIEWDFSVGVSAQPKVTNDSGSQISWSAYGRMNVGTFNYTIHTNGFLTQNDSTEFYFTETGAFSDTINMDDIGDYFYIDMDYITTTSNIYKIKMRLRKAAVGIVIETEKKLIIQDL